MYIKKPSSDGFFCISQITGLLRSDFPENLPGSAEEAVLVVQNFHLLVNESVDLVNPQSQFLCVSGRPQVQDDKALSPEAEKTDHSVLHQPELPCCDLDRKSTRLNSSHVKISYA